jgi:hypothetical protein
MKHRSVWRLALLFVAVSFVASCATTRISHVWKDESFNGKLGNVLVIAVAERPIMRSFAENAFVEQLQARGVSATASSKVMPSDKMLDRAAIVETIREHKLDFVLVTRVAGKEEIEKTYEGGVYVVPTAYYSGWYGFYTDSFAVVSVPGSAYDQEIFSLVTNVYDARNEKLVWSAISKTMVENGKEKVVEPFVATIVKRLADSRLL